VTEDAGYMSQVLFPNESVSTILARIIGIVGPIDTKMLALGQETQKYFTEEYDLFHKNEVQNLVHFFQLVPVSSNITSSTRSTFKYIYKKTNIILVLCCPIFV
jgi:hypothetical protein